MDTEFRLNRRIGLNRWSHFNRKAARITEDECEEMNSYIIKGSSNSESAIGILKQRLQNACCLKAK